MEEDRAREEQVERERLDAEVMTAKMKLNNTCICCNNLSQQRMATLNKNINNNNNNNTNNNKYKNK